MDDDDDDDDDDDLSSMSSFELIESEKVSKPTNQKPVNKNKNNKKKKNQSAFVLPNDILDFPFKEVDISGGFETVSLHENQSAISDYFSEVESLSDVDADASARDAIGHSKQEESLSSEILFSIPEFFDKLVFTALVDSGCSKSLLNEKIVRDAGTVKIRNKQQKWVTKAGEFRTHGKSELTGLVLPQFTSSRKIEHSFHLFTKTRNDRYDMILGRDLTQKLGLDILNSERKFKWNGIEVQMVPSGHWSGHKKRQV